MSDSPHPVSAEVLITAAAHALPDGIDVLDPAAVPYNRGGMTKLGLNPPPSDAGLARWRLKGRFGIRPATFLRCGRRYTTPTAMAAFFEAVTAAAEKKPPSSDSRAARLRRVAVAQEALERDGA